MKPTLVLVGRPNVGKSTLFNRLTKTRDALVADQPGLTRDRHYGHGKLGSKPYLVVDTGGFEPLAKDGIMHEMARQTEQAIAEADAVIFLVDGRTGVTALDKDIANKLRKIERPIIVAVNKAEAWIVASWSPTFTNWGWVILSPFPQRTAKACAIWSSTSLKTGRRQRKPNPLTAPCASPSSAVRTSAKAP